MACGFQKTKGGLDPMKRWQFWVGAIVSIMFLFFALRKVDLASAWQAALSARQSDLLLAWLCLLASYIVRAWRWRIIMYSIKPASFWTMWRVFVVGFMANNILPVRMGEIVRAYVLGQIIEVNAASVLGTIAVERVLDVIMVLMLLAVGVAFGMLAGIGGSVWLGAAMVGVLIAGVLVLAVWGEQLADWGERIVGRVSPSWAKKIADLGRSFVRGLRSVGSLNRAVRITFWAAVSWGLFMAYAHFILRAYGLNVGPAGVAFLLGLAGMGVAIPSAPGSVGTLEYAYIFGLGLLKVGDENTRASFALTYHVLEWVTTLILGLFCLGQLGLSLRQVTAMAGQNDPMSVQDDQRL
jgi:uncharacterized protein (TIRG00374 family)